MRAVWKALWLMLLTGAVLLAGGCAAAEQEAAPAAAPVATEAPTQPRPTESPTVRVTFPEGYTVLRIAERLEENGVCTAEEFLQAVQQADLSDYPFAAEIPLLDGDGEPNGRVWRLEGYLFPDTYEFYRHCSGGAALAKFLQNFSRKYEQIREDLTACGLTLDQAVTLASILQWEGSNGTDMARMSRVLWNRLESPSYPKLQCDTTTRYLRQLKEAEIPVREEVYDTYTCRGLPVGPIDNPGLAALKAAVAPSDEEICAGCYFFFTDADSGAVYYSRTYAQHQAAWQKLQAEKAKGGDTP